MESSESFWNYLLLLKLSLIEAKYISISSISSSALFLATKATQNDMTFPPSESKARTIKQNIWNGRKIWQWRIISTLKRRKMLHNSQHYAIHARQNARQSLHILSEHLGLQMMDGRPIKLFLSRAHFQRHKSTYMRCLYLCWVSPSVPSLFLFIFIFFSFSVNSFGALVRRDLARYHNLWDPSLLLADGAEEFTIALRSLIVSRTVSDLHHVVVSSWATRQPN